MKKLLTLCMMLAVAAMAYAGKIETKKADDVNSQAFSVNSTEVPMNLAEKIADLEAQLEELRVTGGDQSAVRAMLEKYRSLAPRNGNSNLDLACADCAPAHADLGVIGNVVYNYFISGDLGTDGKWVARFDGVAGTVYHWDLCSTAPGAGTNAGFVSDIDIRIKDAAFVQVAYNDGFSGCVPSWSPNDFTWTCVTAGTYFVEIKEYSDGTSTCTGTTAQTFTLNYYGAGTLPPPVNDQCAGALALSVPGVVTCSTADALDEYNAGCPYTSSAKDVV